MSDNPIAIIAGTALQQQLELNRVETLSIDTPYGKPSDVIISGFHGDQRLLVLARHGANHSIAPHNINYRANIWALHKAGASEIIALASVGGISSQFSPGVLAIPDQIIDYSYNREQTFFNDDFSIENHTDFTLPFDHELRARLVRISQQVDAEVIDGATVAVTQGPRLETAAEIRKLQKDGCDIVNMTAMPEAILARELGVAYASLALVVNWAAGIADEMITIEEIKNTVSAAESKIKLILQSI